MIFSLDVRRARKGDCLLLHFGTRDDPGLVMIDGGPASVFTPHLKPRLEEIRKGRGLGTGDSLPVDLLMVSHVDDDHIRGILDLTKAEIEAVSAHRAPLLTVLDFWHNSFDALIDHTPEELTATFKKQFGEAAVKGGGLSDEARQEVEEESEEKAEIVRSGLKVLASIEQGFRLRLDAESLGYPLNPDFDGKLIIARKGGKKVDLGRGLKLTVVGPMKPEVMELHKKHQAWLRELEKEDKSPPSALAAYVDRSVPNLSSIVVLAEAGKKRMLLTGDARGDKVLQGLELVGLLGPGKTMEVDVLKVPHHGSANNLDNDFFQRIVARHYVFSGDGEHGNPEREALEMLFRARGSDPFVVHLTYPVKEIDAERKKDWEKEQKKEKAKRDKAEREGKAPTEVRADWSDEKQGLAAFFEQTALTGGQEVRIVDAKKPHLIDLLETPGF